MTTMTTSALTVLAMAQENAQAKREWQDQLRRTKDDCWRLPSGRYVTHEQYAEYKMTGRVPELSGGEMRKLLNEKRFWDPIPDPTPLNIYDL